MDQRFQEVCRVGAHHHLVVLGAQVLGHAPRIGQLVEARLVEADGKGLERLGEVAGHQRADHAGIQPAAQEGAEGHVRDQPHAHGIVQFGKEPLLQRVLVVGPLGQEVHVAVAGLDDVGGASVLAGLDAHPVAGGQLADALEDGIGRWDVAQAEEVLHRVHGNAWLPAGHSQQRLQLGAEAQDARRQLAQVERLLADAVARQH